VILDYHVYESNGTTLTL